VAGVDEEPAAPPLEPGGVPQTRQAAPDADQGLLGRVIGLGAISQDAVGKAEETGVGVGGEHLERSLVALLRPDHEVCVHTPYPFDGRPAWPPSPSGLPVPNFESALPWLGHAPEFSVAHYWSQDLHDEDIVQGADMRRTEKKLVGGEWVEEPVMLFKPKDIVLLIDRLEFLFDRPARVNEGRDLTVTSELPVDALQQLVELTRGSAAPPTSPLPRTPRRLDD